MENDQTDNGTDVTVTTDDTGKSTTHLHDGKVTFTSDVSDVTHVAGEWEQKRDERVRNLIKEAQNTRQKTEDVRANRRNANRSLMLLVTVVAGFIVTFGLEQMGSLGRTLLPYDFVITAVCDMCVTAWAWWKHY